MSAIDYRRLPFWTRPDLTPYLIHLTRARRGRSGFENLVNILRGGVVRGSTTQTGFIKGSIPAACFMDVPFHALKSVCTPENAERYEPYGVVVSKRTAYERGARPVLYLSGTEQRRLDVPRDQLWRVVKLEVSEEGWVSWLHEREWRCPHEFRLPKRFVAAIVRSLTEVGHLQEMLEDDEDFKSLPKCILPLEVICQGLPKPLEQSQ
ncbi:MAG: hypothetical protein HYY65_01440 [Candidatus Tectomicrobia bacterium]|uniref:DUF2971 domain-containing protein n=1 Tax=Tectimicrobiota bacterium TaxID=2528274 RepID=A0A932GMJ1_UNCTE|nr:hypothetical protein [Candidatus Tectomicrobia bacterium]